jgi:hypothetical protein
MYDYAFRIASAAVGQLRRRTGICTAKHDDAPAVRQLEAIQLRVQVAFGPSIIQAN